MPLPAVVVVIIEAAAAIAARQAAKKLAQELAKKAAQEAAKKAAQEAAKKAAQEAAKKAAQEAAKKTAQEAAKKTAQEAAKKTAQQASKKAASSGAKKGNTPANKYKDKGKKKEKKQKGPCDHLKKGKGKGDYRGGAHSETSKPRNDGKDSHHMPADEASPLPKKDGPAIQMDPKDHKKTTSNGNNGLAGKEYRKQIAEKISQGKWRDAMATEVKDARKVAKKAGDPKKYNEAIKESLAYFKCLEKHGLLKKSGE